MNRRSLARLIAVSFLAGAAAASAQDIVDATMTGQALQFEADGRVTGCGLRIAASRLMLDGRTDTSETTVGMYTDGAATVEATAYAREAMKEGVAPTARAVKVRSAWVKGAGGAATAPLGSPSLGDDKLSLVYATKIEPVFGIFLAQRKGRPLQLSVARNGETSAPTLSGVPRLEVADERRLTSCVEALIREATAGQEAHRNPSSGAGLPR
jgi:hypothetical protein